MALETPNLLLTAQYGRGFNNRGYKVVSKAPRKSKCPHHWVMEADKVMKLSPKKALLYPNAIGRRSVCKLCGRHEIKPEQLN